MKFMQFSIKVKPYSSQMKLLFWFLRTCEFQRLKIRGTSNCYYRQSGFWSVSLCSFCDVCKSNGRQSNMGAELNRQAVVLSVMCGGCEFPFHSCCSRSASFCFPRHLTSLCPFRHYAGDLMMLENEDSSHACYTSKGLSGAWARPFPWAKSDLVCETRSR